MLDMITIVDVVLLALLSITAVAILMMRHLFAVVALTGAFSLLSAGLLVTLDAVDVAFTEAAVGAGISTVLILYFKLDVLFVFILFIIISTSSPTYTNFNLPSTSTFGCSP